MNAPLCQGAPKVSSPLPVGPLAFDLEQMDFRRDGWSSPKLGRSYYRYWPWLPLTASRPPVPSGRRPHSRKPSRAIPGRAFSME